MCVSSGISFRPSGEDGRIRCHHRPGLGVCGTGLKTEEYGTGTTGTCDNAMIWDCIVSPAEKGGLAAATDNADDRRDEHGDAAMNLIDNTTVTVTVAD